MISLFSSIRQSIDWKRFKFKTFKFNYDIKKQTENKQTHRLNIRAIVANPYTLIAGGVFVTIAFLFVINAFVNLIDSTVTGIQTIDFNQSFETNTVQMQSSILTFDHFTQLSQFTTILLIALVVSVLYVAYKLYEIHRRYRTLNIGQKGDSRFTTLQEMKDIYRMVPHRDESYTGESGFPISHYRDRYFIDDSTSNTCIIGTSRSGKGQTAVFPAIDLDSRAERQPCMLVGDPKGELYSASYKPLNARGYDVYALNLLDPDNGMSYNPLEIIKQSYEKGDYAQAQADCSTLTNSLFMGKGDKGDPFWDASGANLTNALILATVEKCYREKSPEQITMGNVYRMLLELGQVEEDEEGNESSKLDEYFEKLPPDHIAKPSFAQLKFSKNNTRSSIYAVTTGKLEIFSRIQIDKMTSKNSIDFNRIGFNKRMYMYFTEGYAFERGEIIFKSEDTHPIKETFQVDAFGSASINFDEQLEDGDMIDIYMNDQQYATYIFHQVATEYNEYTQQMDYAEEASLEFVEAQGASFLTQTKLYYSNKPVAIFMIIPDYDSSRNTIASIFISQVYTNLARSASLTRDNKCHQRVKFRLDEFGNLPAIHDMETNITVSLGRNILWELYVQGYSQLDSVYGKETARTIKNNCQNHVYIMSTEKETADEISEKCGKKTVQSTNRSGKELGGDISITDSVEAEPIILPQELLQMKEGDTVVLRFLKRKDLDGNKVTAYPIKNTELLSMPFAYQFLSHTFDDDTALSDFDIPSNHRMLQIKDILIDWSGRMTQNQPSYLSELQLSPDQLERLKGYIQSIGGGNDAFEMLKRKETKEAFESVILNFSANLKMDDKEKAKVQVLEAVNRIINDEADDSNSQQSTETDISGNDELFLDPYQFPYPLYERCLDYLSKYFDQAEISDFKSYPVQTFKNHMNNIDKSFIYKEIVEHYRNH